MLRTLLTLLGGLLLAGASPLETALAQPAAAASASARAAVPARQVPLQSPDAAIQARLAELYRQISGLHDVRAEVHGGVVTLVGTTLDVGARDRAEDIAAQLDGVVAVENRLSAEHRVSRRLQPLVAKSREMAGDLLAFLPVLAVALVAFVGFWLLGGALTRSTALFHRLAPNPFIESVVKQVVRLVFLVVGLIVAMSILGATALLGSVLGAAGVIGLAVGFAVRDTIENYIASILLSVRQPFAPGDTVIIEGFEGKITRLNSRATILTTGEGNEVRIPNATVYKANIVNLTHTPERRFEFEVPVALDTDLSCALAAALRAVKRVPGVLREPQPATLVDRIDGYAIVLRAQVWVDQRKSDFGKVQSEAIRAVREAFAAGQIVVPEPVQAVRLPDHAAGAAGGSAAGGTASPPTAAEMTAIRDTRADRAIDDKVRASRARASEDLLTADAPRE